MIVELLLALALAQGLTTLAPGATGGGKVLASFPLTTSGPLITEDANTVAHVYWNGTALVDTKGNAWTENGTVPQVTANPFTSVRYGAGPFSAANYYSLGTGNDILDFTGEFTVCGVYTTAVAGAWQVLLSDSDPVGLTGWLVGQSPTNLPYVYVNAASISPANSAVIGGPNVLCVGRAATTAYIKLNLGATASTASAAITPATTSLARIGRVVGGAASAFGSGQFYEVYATSTPFTEATVTAIQQKVLGHFDGYAPLAVTRATNATYENPAGTIWTAAPGVARITTDGLLVEPARTNYILQSNTMSTGTASTSPWGLGAATSVSTVAGAPMGGTWAEVVGTTSNGFINQSVTAGAAYTQGVLSTWMAKASGTGYASVQLNCSTACSACTCARSDGGTCTATMPSGIACNGEVSDLGTTPIRLWVVATCNSATTHRPYLIPGQAGVGTTRFSGAQLEVGTYPTSLIVTAGTAVARNADTISATVPAVPSKWCVAGNFAPATGTWGDTGGGGGLMWTIGTSYNAANTASSWTNHSLWVFDSASAAKDLGAFPSTPASPWRFVTCNSLGSLSLTVNGLVVDTTATGVGTGILTTPSTTLLLGHRGLAAGYEFGGYLKNLKICAAKSAKECK